MRREIRAAQPAVFAAAVLAGVASAFVTPSVKAAGPSLSVVPAANLVDGQFVKVSLSGFPPLSGVAFRECIAAPQNAATDCTPRSTIGAATDAGGGGNTYLPVQVGKLNNSGATGAITCDVTTACVIAAVQTLSDLTNAVFAPISFAPSKSNCPLPGANGILGGGASSAYRALYGWESTVCLPPSNLAVDYTLSNSVSGVDNFFNGLADFGVAGPLPAQSATPPAGSTLTFRFAPLTTSAVVLAFRMYDNTGPEITSIKLTPDVIAKIFLGQVPNWNANATIKTLNPGVAFPGRITPFVRAEHSAQTYVFTSWLAANAPATWTASTGTPLGSSTIFPVPPTTVQGVTGSDALGQQIALLAPNDPLDVGGIGFTDSSTAAFYGLPTVQIQRADRSLIDANPASLAQAVKDATVQADGTLAVNYTNLDAGAYPMPMPTYMLAPSNTIDPARGATLAAFLRYAVQAGQQNLPPGYAPLPANLVTESLKVAGAIPVTAPPTPTPTPTTTPKATPTPSLRPAPVPTTLPAYPAPPPLATMPPVPTPSATASPCAHAASPSPNSAASAAASPLATASATATPAVPACPTAAASAASTTPPGGQQFTQIGDWTAARFVLPSVFGFGLFGLAGGVALGIVARRRRIAVGDR